MKKIKNLVLGIMLMLPVVVNASEVEINRIVTEENGEFTFVLNNINIESGKSYEWCISSTNTDIGSCYTVSDYDVNNKTISFSLTEKIADYLIQKVDLAYLTVKEKDSDVKLVEAQQLDLVLPPLVALSIDNYGYVDAKYQKMSIGSKTKSYMFEKITDENIINAYKASNGNISNLSLKSASEHPSVSDSNWKITDYISSKFISYPTESGLYYLWIKFVSNSGYKTIYGYKIIDIGVLNNQTVTTTNNNTTKTSSNNVKNPNTGDNILYLAGLGFVIVGGITLSYKKLKKVN